MRNARPIMSMRKKLLIGWHKTDQAQSGRGESPGVRNCRSGLGRGLTIEEREGAK